MQRPYKIILAISAVLAVLMAVLINKTTHVWGSYFYIGGLLFVIYSAIYSTYYYAVKRDKYTYSTLLVLSFIITAFLFIMEYMFWDNDPPNPPLRQIVFESAVYGTLYMFLIWVVLCVLFHTFYGIGWLLKKLLATVRPS